MDSLYDSILSLCDSHNIRPGRLCDELGLSRGLMTDLKMGRKKGVSAETAQKIAAYFGVSVGYLLGQEGASKSEDILDQVDVAFYGDFKEYGLYIFCKDDLSEEEVILTMEYASDLQRHLDITYSKMYLSLIDKLYVCDLTNVDRLRHKTQCTSYDISRKMCKEFFIKSLD